MACSHFAGLINKVMFPSGECVPEVLTADSNTTGGGHQCENKFSENRRSWMPNYQRWNGISLILNC